MPPNRTTHHSDLNGRDSFPASVDPQIRSRVGVPTGNSQDSAEAEEWVEIWPYAAPISYRAQHGWQRTGFPVGGVIVGSVVLGGLVAAGWHSWRLVAPMLQNPAPPQFQEAVRPGPAVPRVAISTQPEADPEAGAAGPMQAGQRGRVIEPLGLYLRAEPNTDGSILEGIVMGETVTVLALSSDEEWQQVRRELNGQQGWVKSGYLSPLDADAPEIPLADPADPQEEETPSEGSVGTHRVSEPLGLYLRSAPDADAAPLGGIAQGEAVTLLSTSPDGQWQRVRRQLDGSEGWVKGGNLSPDSGAAQPDLASAQAAAPPGAPATPDPNLRPSSTGGDIFTYSAGSQARVMSPIGLALRAEPDATGSYVGGIPVNEVVQVLGVSQDGQWQKVRRQGGQEGWVKAGNLGPE